MTPQTVLIDLLERLAARRDDAVLVSDYDLGQWPPEAMAALKSQKLITKARASASAVSPGCERECAMPVQVLFSTTRSPAAFIVCDKRSDTNRVPVPLDRLTQWQCSTQAVCGFVAYAAGVRSATTADPRYTPSTAKREVRKHETQAMYESWRKAYQALKRKHPEKSDVWYSQQIAKTSIAQGRNASTIKKHMLS